MNETVIISLTSHSIRLKQSVGLTIFSLIKNDYPYSRIVLTVYKDDIPFLSDDLKRMINSGRIELITADQDLGPHLKYYYTMRKYRAYPVITVDDDVIYPETMVSSMVQLYNQFKCVIARRCFEITSEMDYYKWLTAGYKKSAEPTHKLFATGIGGILYPPNCFKLTEEHIPELLKIKYDDDFYLKALEVRNNIPIVCHTSRDSEIYKVNLVDNYTQSIALWNSNSKRANAGLRMFKTEFLKCLQGNYK